MNPPKKLYECPYCGDLFTQKGMWREHIIDNHGNDLVENTIEPKEWER